MNAPEQNFELHRFEDAKLAYFTFEGLVEWPTLKKAIRYAYEEEVGDPEWEIIWDFRNNVPLVFDPGDVAAMVDFVKGYAQEGRRPGKVVVLVSEFNEGIMRLYQHLSSKSGFVVERAWSLREALDLLEEKPPPGKVRERL